MVKEIDLVVRGAQLVTSGEPTEADLYVHGGKVVGVGRLDLSSREVVDGKGLFLLPGMIDAHVHFMDPGDLTREGFPQGSAAAAVAGVTTVLEHSHGIRVTNGASLQKKIEYLKDRSVIDFGLGAHFSPKGNEEILEALQGGAAFIKVFTCTTHGVDAVENGLFFEAMKRFEPEGAVYLVHAEDESLTRVAEIELRRAGREDGMVIPEWRNRLAEQVAVTTVAQLAQASGAKVAIAHCSHPEIVDIISRYRAQGARIWAEGCPQYFHLREDEIKQLGAFRKFTPPARAMAPNDFEAMWERLRNGAISYLASDHAPSTRSQKSGGSIWDVHFGLPGIDTTFPVMLDAVCRGTLSLSRLVELYALMPARLYGLYPQKGTLQVGSDADFILVDLKGTRILQDKDILSKAGWTPFAGHEVKGRVVATYLRGQKVAEGGRCLASPGTGRFIPGQRERK
jgi:dihydroorotase (multifunctional complex type)